MKWNPVPEYESLYEVSSKGDVRSIGKGPHRHTGRVLTWKVTREYAAVDLARDGRKRRFSIHTLVLLAHVGPRPFSRAEGNHKNGNKRDNHYKNLEWTTHTGNGQHASASGLLRPPSLKGESNGRAKLTVRDVEKIRALRGTLGQRAIAKAFGVSRTAIQLIHQGKHWL